MKNYIFLFLFILSGSMAMAQSHDVNPCGTPSYKTEWLKKYQANPNNYETKSGADLFLPLKVHLLSSDGTNHMSESRLLDAMCTLSKDFEESGIGFFIAGAPNYIIDGGYFEHGDILTGAEMMFTHNDDNFFNNYVVRDPAGNCGYNLPYAGVALGTNCAGINDHTWAHEIGHGLSLPHPFLGWEGGVSHDGTVGHNFNEAAPEYVTYDYSIFQQEFYPDTLIIDTAYVEKIDGSNCYEAADGFCDTKPDYLASRWACDPENNSNTLQTDPNGESFYSDGSLIMSYANDNCSSRFSAEQIGAMRANLIDEKGDIMSTVPAPPLATTSPILATPSPEEIVSFEDVRLTWDYDVVDDIYLVELSPVANMGFLDYDTIVSGKEVVFPSLKLTNSFGNDKYYWRVRAIDRYDFCTENYSNIMNFVVSDAVSNTKDELSEITIFPTNTTVGSQLNINGLQGEGTYMIYNTDGKLLQNDKLKEGANRIATHRLNTGIQIITIQIGSQIISKKIVLTK